PSTSIQRADEATTAASAPNDHLAASPDRCVLESAMGRVGGAAGCRAISAGIISSAGVKGDFVVSLSSPNDHFAAGPNCRVTLSDFGRVDECRWSPRVINAASRGTSYCR